MNDCLTTAKWHLRLTIKGNRNLCPSAWYWSLVVLLWGSLHPKSLGSACTLLALPPSSISSAEFLLLLRSSHSQNQSIAIVCSARSGKSKAEGTTNRYAQFSLDLRSYKIGGKVFSVHLSERVFLQTKNSHLRASYWNRTSQSLLKAAREAIKPNSTNHRAIVSGILHEHLNTVNFSHAEIEETLKRDISAECNALAELLDSLPKTEDVPPEEAEDKILSVGEKLSAQYLTALLEDHGVQSQYVDLSDVIEHKTWPSLNQDFYRELAYAIGRRIDLCGDKVPVWHVSRITLRGPYMHREWWIWQVLTGYFGSLPGGLLKQLGRGYSDLCAALAAVGTKAKELQVSPSSLCLLCVQ